MKVDKLMVVVQIYGPIETSGRFGSLGRTSMVGRTAPRVVSDGAADDVDEAGRAEVLEELEAVPDDCGDIDTVVGVEFGVDEEKLNMIVEDGSTLLRIALGIETGQKLQTFLPWSQYRSISNLRKPRASRLERQSPELSSSYRRLGKQAAEKETPGVVTKLIGTLSPRSR